jgi:hypothetical protein
MAARLAALCDARAARTNGIMGAGSDRTVRTLIILCAALMARGVGYFG